MHKFENISFQVDIQEEKPQNSWEQFYGNFVQNQFLPKVEAVLDHWDKQYPNLNCVIDRIDITMDIDTLNLKLLQKLLLAQFENELAKINVKYPELSEGISAQIKPVPTHLDALIVYLKEGVLPNFVKISELKSRIKSDLISSNLGREKIRNLVLDSQVSLRRLATLFEDKPYHKLAVVLGIQDEVGEWLNFDNEFIVSILKELFRSLGISFDRQQMKGWLHALRSVTTLNRFVEITLNLLRTKGNVQVIGTAGMRQFELAIIRAVMQQKFRQNITVDFSGYLQFKKFTFSEKRLQNDKVKNDKEDGITSNKDQKNAGLTTSEEEINGVNKGLREGGILREDQLQNVDDGRVKSHLKFNTEKAGLLLMHPFYKKIFSEFELLDDENKIVNPGKAIQLLHYLATGNDQTVDMDLNLEKTLLGIAVSSVIDMQEQLSKKEKSYCNAQLNLALNHWNILKSGSIKTLREMFLMRDGTIEFDSKRIRIQIEKLAQDILLDKIPWNISIIKLPWVKALIMVDWS